MRRLIAICALILPLTALATETAPEIHSPPFVRSSEIVVGFGFGGFTSQLNDVTSVGLAWTIRVGFNVATYLGVELDYQGAASGAHPPVPNTGAPSTTNLYANDITLNLRAQLPIPIASHALRPFAFLGGGYGHVSGVISAKGVPIPTADAGAFPFGGGLAFDLSAHYFAEARYTYDVLTAGAGNSWNVVFAFGGRIGK